MSRQQKGLQSEDRETEGQFVRGIYLDEVYTGHPGE